MNAPFVSLVVATKDRPADLARLLASLSAQTRKPDQVVVIDASADPVEHAVKQFTDLNLVYQRYWPPSGTAQRNAGVRLADPRATLIGFVDDDAAFEPDSFEKMLAFWMSAGDVLGASFNILNYELPSGQALKRSTLANWLGLYASRPGAVAPSGWQSIFGRVSATSYVDWLPSGAVLWRSELLRDACFDEYFTGYSYLEDLDFSFGIGRRGKLAVVAEAGYSHFPSAHGRVSLRNFGRVEVRNRLYFVRKHGLSVVRCRCCIVIRAAMTLAQGLAKLDRSYFSRLLGNLEGLAIS